MEVEGPPPSSNEPEWDKDLKTRYDRLRSILLYETIIPLNLDFLFRNNHSDLIILKKIKEAISERNSVLNNALICCNSIMHCGTTIDQFLRDNLDWMGRAAHWAKFTATASLGQIHHHHLESSMTILEKYLPGSGGGPYQEGGSLYALGLIHVGSSENNSSTLKIKEYLLKHMSQASNEIIQHGSCLGLGLSSLGTQQNNYLQEIRNILFQDRAVPGESAGISLGLILSGSGNMKWFDEMFQYAHETQHEKIIRGLGIGIAIMFYNLEENANHIIDLLIHDKTDTLRYGGCYAIGLAYACTANNYALSLLLHLAVSDVSNDVRRAAVTNIGFVLGGNKYQQVPKVVQLLANSYNSHVRYGAAAALGIACAGTGNLHALKLLKNLAKDQTDYVRQAAFISLGMLLMQHNDKETPQVKYVREELFMKTILNKRESTMSIMGAILGFGLIDACGRNATISLLSFEGQKRMQSIVGMAVFWQYWYWYPLVPFITLSFQPTMIMALNRNLQMPEIIVRSNAPSSLYAYVEPLKEEAKESKKVLTKAVLSTTNKQKARQAQIEKAKKSSNEGEDVEMTDNNEDKDKDKNKDDKNKEEEEQQQQSPADDKNKEQQPPADNNNNKMELDEKTDEKKEEPKFQLLSNPARVTPNQQKYIVWWDKRYRPISKRLYGIVVVEDTMPDEEVKLVEFKTLDTQGVYGNEPEPPKPFYYLRD